MNLLIEDLLQVSKIETGRMPVPKPISTQMLVDDAVAMLEPLARRHDMTVEVKTSADLPMIQADYERILRVFSNLIVNAIKFSLIKCNITVAAHRAGKMVRFSIIDCGTGIAADHLPLLFDRFWQANPQDRRGVGLAIAKAIVTAHGGTIGAESTAGKGSEFWFELPEA